MKPQTWQRVERLLKAHGAVFVNSRGSHFHWRMPNGAMVTVPHHRLVPVGTLLSIFRQAGIPKDDMS